MDCILIKVYLPEYILKNSLKIIFNSMKNVLEQFCMRNLSLNFDTENFQVKLEHLTFSKCLLRREREKGVYDVRSE